MLGFVVTDWINQQYVFVQGSTWLQWITSIVAFGGWGMYFHARFGEDRCEHCLRKGTIPVSGSVHKHCRTHALEHGTTHT